MSQLDLDIRAADEAGLSYGYYIAKTYYSGLPKAPPAECPKKRHRKRKYTDEQLFRLWQERKTDQEIGEIVGVSRQFIQRWRDQLELPSTSKNIVETQKYRLTKMGDGTPVVVMNDEV